MWNYIRHSCYPDIVIIGRIFVIHVSESVKEITSVVKSTGKKKIVNDEKKNCLSC